MEGILLDCPFALVTELNSLELKELNDRKCTLCGKPNVVASKIASQGTTSYLCQSCTEKYLENARKLMHSQKYHSITCNDRHQDLKGIDLFAGAGGFSCGMQMAGIDVVAAVELEKYACDTLRMNAPNFFPNMQVIQADIQTLTGKEILDKVGLAIGELDILFGGPPCQGFSFLNTSSRGPDNPKSKLMWEFIRMVGEMQPRMFMIENVPGLLSFKDFFISLLESLEQCGYVVRFNMLDAVSYGVPQHRRRVLIMGTRSDTGKLPVFPPPQNFAPEMLTGKEGTFFPRADVAVECFAKNGFSKEEMRDVWWNTKLWILMNKKTAEEIFDKAIHNLTIKAIEASFPGTKHVGSIFLKPREIHETTLSDFTAQQPL